MTITKTVVVEQTQTTTLPLWRVVLHDSDQHSFIYVINMLMKIFAKNQQDAELLSLQVHQLGYAEAARCSRERAELYLQQVQAYGADDVMLVMGNRSDGPLPCTIEPAP